MQDTEPQTSQGLSAKQEVALPLLLRNLTVRQTARALKIDESTLYRWLAEPAFSRAYREARNRALETTLTALQAASSDAVMTLKSVMTDKLATPSARVSAARSVLEFTLRAKESLELEQRLEALEARLLDGKQGGSDESQITNCQN